MAKKFMSMHLDTDSFLKATDEEKSYIVQMRPSTTFFKDGCKRFLKNKVATVSLIIIVLIVLIAIFLPMFWPYSYEQQLGVIPGKPVDPSFNNLRPFEYGSKKYKRFESRRIHYRNWKQSKEDSCSWN